jgi:hypothetical protein
MSLPSEQSAVPAPDQGGRQAGAPEVCVKTFNHDFVIEMFWT